MADLTELRVLRSASSSDGYPHAEKLGENCGLCSVRGVLSYGSSTDSRGPGYDLARTVMHEHDIFYGKVGRVAMSSGVPGFHTLV